MPNSKDIAAIPESDALIRESAQIVFGLQNEAKRVKRRKEDRARDELRNPDTQLPKSPYKPIGFVGKKSEQAERDPVRKTFSRRPGVVGKKLHEINKAMEAKDANGYYKSSTEFYDIKSLSSKNVVLTRKGKTEPAFKRVNGQTKVNTLSKAEVAKIHKAHSKIVSKDKGAGRDA